MADIVASRSTSTGRIFPARVMRPLGALFAICGLGLALGACSKCDVPNLLPPQAGPQTCHAGPEPS
ncbi:MAG: hypothetical protein WBE99_14905 [Xanthobacteraceae bacterium]